MRDAARYCSTSGGETFKTSAMLSKPLLSSSAGSSSVTSTSRSSRSRIAFPYSVRFRRCKAARPGFGFVAAARSIDVSRNDTNDSTSACGGRGRPCGGIIPPRSFRMTFSQVSAPSGIWARSILSSIRPAVLACWLWHITQYWSRSARCGEAVCWEAKRTDKNAAAAMPMDRPRTMRFLRNTATPSYR